MQSLRMQNDSQNLSAFTLPTFCEQRTVLRVIMCVCMHNCQLPPLLDLHAWINLRTPATATT